MDRMESVIRHHRRLVNDDAIVLPDGVVEHLLLIGRNRDVKQGVDCVSLEVRVEFVPIVGVLRHQSCLPGSTLY